MYTFKPFVLTKHSPTDNYEPDGRSGSKIYSKGQNLYIYGGRDPIVVDFQELGNDEVYVATRPEFRDLWVFNLLSKEWTFMDNEDDLPGRNNNQIGVMYEANLLTICTIRVPYFDKQTNLYVCNLLNGNVINQHLRGAIPYPCSPRNLIRDGQYYYTIGVLNDLSDRVADVYRVNMENGHWECVYKCNGKNINEPLGDVYYLVFDGKRIFSFSGIKDPDGFDTFSFTKIPVFDVETRRWNMIDTYGDVDNVPSYPKEREDFYITDYKDSNDNMIVILSGRIDDKVPYNDLWKLNLSNLTWKCIDNHGTLIPQTFSRYSITVSPEGQLFTFGGFVGDLRNKIPCGSDVHSVWITIPKLSDICWESILYYWPNLATMPKEEIKNLGISWKFFQSKIETDEN